MFRHILLAYDGTTRCGRTLSQGAELARASGARVTLLAVIEESSSLLVAEAVGPADLLGREAELHCRVLQRYMDQLASRGLRVDGRIAYGAPEDEISAVATEVGADLVVLGPRSVRMNHRWLGPPGEARLPPSPCPLLFARD